MINRQRLLKDLQQQLPKIEKDILAYSESRPELTEHLKSEYQKAINANRTADHFFTWRGGQITQAAVAWILICVFVRFLEDNQLLDAPVLAGSGERLKHAKDRIQVHFNDNPTHGERDYLLTMFAELEKLPAIKELLDHQHNPLWQIPVSSDGAKLLVDFFQKIDPETGEIIHDFADANWDTRFLGDLYQDLSIAVQKKYALLQTPEFVESFILDYTLEKAENTFGLKGLRMIDPTCGSGHFLLTGFERIFNKWCRREPTTNTRELAQRALNSVYGVDLNPYAIAICRFRLLIAAMQVSGTSTMRQAPDFHFNLAVGDSLLHGKRFEGTSGTQSHLMDEDDPIKHVLEVEDKEKLSKILGQQYHAVVGNPPYIQVKDSALNNAYREKYATCYKLYSLGVPFTERFFDLTISPVQGQPSGYMGMITTNSFMKRAFGEKLINEYLHNKDLTHILDTSGAYIPGHGTPTVILFGRNQLPKADTIRVALGIRAEPETPDIPSEGKVWSSIVNMIEQPDSENDFISVDDKNRDVYRWHPWSLSGGGAVELRAKLDLAKADQLGKITKEIGFSCITKQDDVFLQNVSVLQRHGISNIKSFGNGEELRDWDHTSQLGAIFPYDENVKTKPIKTLHNAYHFLWPQKTILEDRKVFGGMSYRQSGKPWYEYGQIPVERYKIKRGLVFAEIASHNHFIFDSGEKLFNRTAPVIKLPESVEDKEYLKLLSYLNSSTSCFYMKQFSHQKQLTGGDGIRIEFVSKVPYQFAGVGLKKLPVIKSLNAGFFAETMFAYGARMDELSRRYAAITLREVIARSLKSDTSLDSVRSSVQSQKNSLRSQMILIQEEIDWSCYWAFGLCDKSLLSDIEPWLHVDLKAGQRPFEIHSQLNQDGFEVPKDVPSHWPEDMQAKWRQRIDAIKSNKEIRVIESPHYKRRWIGRQGLFNKAARADEVKSACKEWMLDRLENQYLKHDDQLVTCAGLADRVRNDADFNKVATHYTGNDLFDIQRLVTDLIAGETIPQMAPARYKPSGVTKFRAWQETWDKQRAEDAIDARTELPEDHSDYLSKEAADHLKKQQIGDIPVPPKYAQKDFTKASYWPLRGKLDVPKERFFSLPGCEKSGDTTPVIGWAGMNHLQRAKAIIAWYMDRKDVDGFGKEQLMPMLVALDELIPWLKQWHNEIDPEYSQKLGDAYEVFLLGEIQELEISREDLLSWTPPAATARRGRRTANA